MKTKYYLIWSDEHKGYLKDIIGVTDSKKYPVYSSNKSKAKKFFNKDKVPTIYGKVIEVIK